MSFRVLIADPDPLLLSAYRLLLVGQDIDLDTACTAPACREALQRQPPDLLVLDLELPGLRLDEDLPRPNENGTPSGPLVILTARQDALPDDLLSHPGVTLLFKPVCPGWLIGAIEAFARSSRLASTSAAC
jgi:DNA-binding response OmpR family regulator